MVLRCAEMFLRCVKCLCDVLTMSLARTRAYIIKKDVVADFCAIDEVGKHGMKYNISVKKLRQRKICSIFVVGICNAK